MARKPESGLLATTQGTTDWGVLLLLRVVVSVPLLFFGVLHLVSPDVFREILVTGSLMSGCPRPQALQSVVAHVRRESRSIHGAMESGGGHEARRS